MKFTRSQIKLLLVALAVIVALVYGWLRGDFVATDSGQKQTSAVQKQTEQASATSQETAIVTKVLDGDTIIIQGGEHARLLGIDADESGYPCYQAAKVRLEELVLGKTVQLEKDAQDLDQYGRKLRYVFLDGTNINEKMVAEGMAIARFYPENQKYKDQIVAAETEAIKNKVGCKWRQ